MKCDCFNLECPQRKICEWTNCDVGTPPCPEGHSYMSWSQYEQYDLCMKQMSKKPEEIAMDDLKTQVDELTKVLSALISDIDDHRNENCSSTYWWLDSFLKDLDVSDKLKGKLGLPIDDDDDNEYDF